jgi:lactate dehydrogenase-like 2-hydroxyacid dehydrogenase
MLERQWTMPACAAYRRRATPRGVEDEGGVAVPTVVIVGTLKAEIIKALVERYGAMALPDVDPEAAPGVRVAVTSGVWGVRAEHLDALPGLEVIVNFGVGYDTTDVAEATRRGVALANTPDVLTDCVADTAVGLVIDVMRGLTAADRFVRRGDWTAGRTRPLARRVTGARVGILGMGRIGRAVAHRLQAFGAQLSYHSRTPKADVPHRFARTPIELAQGCDVLVIAAAGGPQSAGIVDAAVLEALGPQGFLVNVARGSLVDERALVSALDAGRLAGAGLDVFADEPHVPEALLTRDDVVLLPHLASGTVETRAAMVDLVLANVDSFLANGHLLTPVPPATTG